MHQEKMAASTRVRLTGCARVPTEYGEFRLCLYQGDTDDKEHLALVFGDVNNRDGVLTRLHSECFTGDVLGSLRCDCGPQLRSSLRMIAQAECGVLLYLRQEGRGIGLLNKLRAYGLQDLGYDTVDANLRLGLVADAREYGTAALILQHLGVRSVELITNNPRKIEGLLDTPVGVRRRIPLEVAPNAENIRYLSTKASRLDHMISMDRVLETLHDHGHKQPWGEVDAWLEERPQPAHRPLVTLSFAQSLDGSIAREPGQRLASSGQESVALTHHLRAWHDGVVVGIGTVLSDDPQLTVRLAQGTSPQPIVIDSTLRFPLHSRMRTNERPPWIAVGPRHDGCKREMLEREGVTVLDVPSSAAGIDLEALLGILHHRGVRRLMVEGGARVLNAFLHQGLADAVIVTITPSLVGGLAGIVGSSAITLPKLTRTLWQRAGGDMVLCAALDWKRIP